MTSNAIAGGKNAAEADWFANYVIPKFTEAQKAKGVNVTLKFQPSGVDDEQYKAKLALDLKSKSGADVIAIDGIWVGEFAEAGYIKPLADVVGGERHDVGRLGADPQGGPGQRVLQRQAVRRPRRHRRPGPLLQQEAVPAGRPARRLAADQLAGHPRRRRQAQDGQRRHPDPDQRRHGDGRGHHHAGRAALLVGTGAEIYKDGKWLGNTQNPRDVLGLLQEALRPGPGGPELQQDAKGRDESFAEFAANKIGILLEGDYFWRSVVNPDKGSAPMANRDADVGYALIPAKAKGAGVSGQDFVSMSGGGGTFLNPNTKFPQQAWELIQFMYSPEAIKAALAGSARITAATGRQQGGPRKDPLLSLISEKVLPITRYRPGLAVYPQVSPALQQATADVVSGKSVDEAAATYQTRWRRWPAGRTRSRSRDPLRRRYIRALSARIYLHRKAGRARVTANAGASDAAGLGRTRAVAFVAPALLLIAAFLVFPAVWTIYLGLTDYRLTGAAAADPQFVGLDNYRAALTDPAFRNSLWLTIVFVFGSAIIGQSVLGFLIAWMMRVASPRRSRPSSRPSSCWPGSCPARSSRSCGSRSSNATAARSTRSSTRPGHGLAARVPDGLDHHLQHLARHGVLDDAVLRRAGAVPPSQLETARLAGASSWQQFRDVVFPHIRGHILTNTLLISLWTFNDFGPVPAHRGRTGPRDRDAAGVHLQARALRRRARLRLGDLVHHAADQPGHRAVLPAAAAERRTATGPRTPGDAKAEADEVLTAAEARNVGQ